MRIFLAGATGALGRVLVPRLVDAGHIVAGMTRSERGAALLAGMGAIPHVADALDADAVRRAVLDSGPELVMHQLTALADGLDPRHFERSFAPTNLLRMKGTDNLLAAAREAGARRVVAQSYAGWPYARIGGQVKTELDPLDAAPPAPFLATLRAIQHLETAVTQDHSFEGIVLRYGAFYGPGTSIALDPPGAQVIALRKRQFPVIGSGAGIWSFIHIEDAAAATIAAVERGGRGTYNIVDDDPAPVAEWLPALAQATGARPPLRLPRFLGRLAAGEAVAVLMTEVRGASNAKARSALGWAPRYSSWRDGFASGLAA